MLNSDHYFGARSFSKPRTAEVNGFIENVERDLRKFYHTHQRSVIMTYVLAVCLGMFGVHHFYLGRKVYGIMYLCTFGLFGVGYVVDLFRLTSLVKDANIRRIDEEEERTLLDLYVLWFPCGILGFHHFYLRNPLLGILYLLTGGMWGLGWIVDGIQLSGIVQQYNNKKIPSLSFVYAYLFMLPPFGILGFHHYYCRRTYWGLLYSLTLGCFFLGWTVDLIRIPFLVSRTEEEFTDESFRKKYYSDDAYVLWMSFGLLGFHHFYLKRYRWGIVYALTLGLFGIGWIVDAFRIPGLVRQLNIETEEEEDIANVMSNFHRHGHSVISAMRKNDNYTRFDDVMQKRSTDGSPRIFTVHSNENALSHIHDSFVDDDNSDDDIDDDRSSSVKVGQLRRTVSSYSNCTQTVAVDVHHVPDRDYMLSQSKMMPVSLNTQGKKPDIRNKPKQSVTEKQNSRQTRDTDIPVSNENETRMKYHELSEPNDSILENSNINTDSVVKVRTNNQSKKRTNSRNAKQQNGSDVNLSSITEKEKIERIRGKGREQKATITLETKSKYTKCISSETQKDPGEIFQGEGDNQITTEKKQREQKDSSAETNVKNNASVNRSYSVISQKSSSRTNVMENSMTSIDVNRMSIPILNDNPAFINDDPCDTPRSARVTTPRVDPDGNSLPRVIKVKKNRSMGQAKRDLRRSIKRSQRRAKASEENTKTPRENGNLQDKAQDNSKAGADLDLECED